MQSAPKEEIAMDSLLEDPFVPLRTYQSTMTVIDRDVQLLMVTNIVNKNIETSLRSSSKQELR